MDELQVVGVQRRRNWAEAQQLAAAYEASGLERQEFCLKYGVAKSTLERYRRRLRQEQSVSPGDGRWLAVEVQPPARRGDSKNNWSGLAVVLSGGRRIEVAPGFDAGTLQKLIGALESV